MHNGKFRHLSNKQTQAHMLKLCIINLAADVKQNVPLWVRKLRNVYFESSPGGHLTICGLVTPYGEIELGQFRLCKALLY